MLVLHQRKFIFCMIPNIQPFEYYDSIKMIVESKNFIFILNEGMDTVMKADKKILYLRIFLISYIQIQF